MPKTQPIVNKILKALAKRKEEGLQFTKRWLCDQTGISEVKMSNVLGGRGKFTDEETDRIGTALDIVLVV